MVCKKTEMSPETNKQQLLLPSFIYRLCKENQSEGLKNILQVTGCWLHHTSHQIQICDLIVLFKKASCDDASV